MFFKVKYFESEFLRNVSYQMIGTGLAQVLPLAATPLLTRLYSENDFATYTAFFAIASILSVGVGARYQFAIVLPLSNSEARKIFSLSIYITIIYSILLLIVFALFNGQISHQLGRSIYLIPLYVLFFGVWNSLSHLSFRYKTFFQNAIAKVLQSMLFVGTGIIMGFLKFTLYGLIVAKILGIFASLLYLLKKSLLRKINKRINLDYKGVAKKYKDYPTYGLIPAFLDIASVQGLVLVLAKFYLASDLGFFGLTSLVLSGPLGLISGSFKDVFYQKIAYLISTRKLEHCLVFFKKSALGLFLLGLPICLVIFFWGEDIFRLIFGERWVKSGEFASMLSVSFLPQLIASPLSSVFNAANKIKIASIWQTLYFFSTFLTLGISAAIFKLKVEDLLGVYVIHEVILYSIYFSLQYWTVKNLK